jgi:DNA-directed RNA polymerase specialized sigma24 family protein
LENQLLKSGNPVEYFVQSYGDLLFDLCQSLLASPIHAQVAFKSIIKKMRAERRHQKFHTYERSWILKIACDSLLKFCREGGHHVSPEEQIKLDSNENLKTRFKEFESYFHLLMPEDQLLLLLRDKLKLPFSEISAAMTIPEGSLKIRRQQALRALEEWLWNIK